MYGIAHVLVVLLPSPAVFGTFHPVLSQSTELPGQNKNTIEHSHANRTQSCKYKNDEEALWIEIFGIFNEVSIPDVFSYNSYQECIP